MHQAQETFNLREGWRNASDSEIEYLKIINCYRF